MMDFSPCDKLKCTFALYIPYRPRHFIAIKRRMRKFAIFLTVALCLNGCEEEKFAVCVTGDCMSFMVIPGAVKDANGYYHLRLDWRDYSYPRFNLYVEASKA